MIILLVLGFFAKMSVDYSRIWFGTWFAVGAIVSELFSDRSDCLCPPDDE